jgi:hypothetical protein
MKRSHNISRPVDQWTGKPLLRFWIRDTSARASGLKVLASRPRSHIDGRHNLWPEYKEDVWCGGYTGYGRGELNEPLFASLKNALRFAQAAHLQGYRVFAKAKGKGK